MNWKNLKASDLAKIGMDKLLAEMGISMDAELVDGVAKVLVLNLNGGKKLRIEADWSGLRLSVPEEVAPE